MAKSTIKSYANNTVWPEFALMIKAKHADQFGMCTCATCPKRLHWRDPQCQAGHAVGGRGFNVLFDEELVYPQCYRCNHILKGNYWEFAQFLRRNGYSYGEIEELQARKNIIKKVTKEELKDLKKYCMEETEKYVNKKGLTKES